MGGESSSTPKTNPSEGPCRAPEEEVVRRAYLMSKHGVEPTARSAAQRPEGGEDGEAKMGEQSTARE